MCLVFVEYNYYHQKAVIVMEIIPGSQLQVPIIASLPMASNTLLNHPHESWRKDTKSVYRGHQTLPIFRVVSKHFGTSHFVLRFLRCIIIGQ